MPPLLPPRARRKARAAPSSVVACFAFSSRQVFLLAILVGVVLPILLVDTKMESATEEAGMTFEVHHNLTMTIPVKPGQPPTLNVTEKCTNGPYVFDPSFHLEGMGATFQHFKYSLILADALNATWIGTLHNKHTYDMQAREGENFAHSYFGLGDSDCSPDDLQARAAELEFVHFQRPKDAKEEYYAATVGGHRFPDFESMCRWVETGTLPAPWMTSNTVVELMNKSKTNESYNYCLFNRRFRSRFQMRQRERGIGTRGRDELWISVHFRWGDLATKSVERPDVWRVGAGLSRYINEARVQMDKHRDKNKTITMHFFSEGNVATFAKFQESFPDAEMHIDGDWRESLDIMTQSNVLIGGSSSFFVLAAHLCDGCSVVTAQASSNKFRASPVEKKLTNYRHVIAFGRQKRAENQMVGTRQIGGIRERDSLPPPDNSTSSCGVLITSLGVGSSDFMQVLLKVARRKASPFWLNDHGDRDGFKHKPATYWREHTASSIKGKVTGKWQTSQQSGTRCFWKVLVIIGDPIHVLTSTFRRFKTDHIDKLKSASGLGRYKSGTTLEQIFCGIAMSGKDETGISHYVSSWRDAQTDRTNWPEVRLVTSRTLYDNAVDIAKWIGVPNGDLASFSRMKYDESWQYTFNAGEVGDEVMRNVSKVFANITKVVDRVESNGFIIAG